MTQWSVILCQVCASYDSGVGEDVRIFRIVRPSREITRVSRCEWYEQSGVGQDVLKSLVGRRSLELYDSVGRKRVRVKVCIIRFSREKYYVSRCESCDSGVGKCVQVIRMTRLIREYTPQDASRNTGWEKACGSYESSCHMGIIAHDPWFRST